MATKSKKAEKKTPREIDIPQDGHRQVEEDITVSPEEFAAYKKQMAEAGLTSDLHKSEAVREMFDFDRKKLPERTRLNLKEIVTFAGWSTMMDALNPDDPRMLPEVYMEWIMRYKLSEGGKSRMEGMSIFQMQSEEKELKSAFTGEGGVL